MDNLLASNNCLNLVRIIAAFQVMLGHLIDHLKLPISGTILYILYFPRGVPIFFALSGFLMWFSIGRSQSYGQYLRKRFWRIYPELWVAVIIELIVILLLYHSWNLEQLIFFALGEGTIFQFWTPDSLREYGVGTPNGTLWTVGVMIQQYFIAWFFYRLMKNRRTLTWIISIVISFVFSFVLSYVTHEAIDKKIIGKLYDQTFIEYFWLFLIGMFIAEFKNKLLPILQKYWYALLIVGFIFFWTGWDLYSGYYLGWSLFLVSGLIGFAYTFPQLSVNPDISYGLFLYHMTVINVFVNYGWTGKWFYAVIVVLIAVVLAYLSTVTIGKISMLRKQKMI